VFGPVIKETRLPQILRKFETELIDEWLKEQAPPGTAHKRSGYENELRAQGEEFVKLLAAATEKGNVADIHRPEFDPVRGLLEQLSSSRTGQDATPTETATFVLSFKRPLFVKIRRELESDANALFQEIWSATVLLDQLALFTTEAFQKTREAVISRQQTEMLELSTPVVKLWDSILALPLIGTLDSQRTQIVMETLLTRIVETGSEVAIIDITGVPMVDTLVAQHLMKTVAAARLMGVECILSGIRPQIAQTIVHLGVDLSGIVTKATLAEAFRVALKLIGRRLPANGVDEKETMNGAAASVHG
jgi:rsbT co-antagonist protein RsbR